MFATTDNHINATAGNIAGELERHWAVFLAQWLRHPRRMSSVTPSGRQLGRLMASALPADAANVVELGAGTGAITAAIIRHGIRPRSLLAVEMNPVLHHVLQQRFPEIHTTCADARELEALVQATDEFAVGQADAICSSLGLLPMPRTVQRDILAAAFRVLRPGGVYIQYTYGFGRPVAESVRDELDLTCTRSGIAWRNLPPARVYVYSRRTRVR